MVPALGLLCKNMEMTTPEGKERLMKHARRLSGTAALAESVRRLRQLRILEAFGTVDFDPKYNYKIGSRRKRR